MDAMQLEYVDGEFFETVVVDGYKTLRKDIQTSTKVYIHIRSM